MKKLPSDKVLFKQSNQNNMNKHVFPQTSEVHLQDRGMSMEFYASLEIYKALLSNPNLLGLEKDELYREPLSIGDEVNDHPIMNDAIQLGKQFCSNFKEKE